MPRRPQVFKVEVEFEQEIMLRDAVTKTCKIAVTKNQDIRTAQDAANHLKAVVGKFDGKDVTRIHDRDPLTGEYTSILRATPVRDEPFDIDEAPVVQSIADAKQPDEKPSA